MKPPLKLSAQADSRGSVPLAPCNSHHLSTACVFVIKSVLVSSVKFISVQFGSDEMG